MNQQSQSMCETCVEIGRTSWGVSGALYLQSAIARANSLSEGCHYGYIN